MLSDIFTSITRSNYQRHIWISCLPSEYPCRNELYRGKKRTEFQCVQCEKQPRREDSLKKHRGAKHGRQADCRGQLVIGQDIKVAEIKAGMKGKIKRLELCEPNLS